MRAHSTLDPISKPVASVPSWLAADLSQWNNPADASLLSAISPRGGSQGSTQGSPVQDLPVVSSWLDGRSTPLSPLFLSPPRRVCGAVFFGFATVVVAGSTEGRSPQFIIAVFMHLAPFRMALLPPCTGYPIAPFATSTQGLCCSFGLAMPMTVSKLPSHSAPSKIDFIRCHPCRYR